MSNRGQYTLEEIMSQPQVWAETLADFAALQPVVEEKWNALRPQRILVSGCGSTYYLSHTAASLIQSLTGLPSVAYPASEIALFPQKMLRDAESTLLLTISRSGTTTETLHAQETFRAHNGRANWTITCYPDSPMAETSDFVLPTAVSAQEVSLAQTRSFTSMLLVAELLAATIAGHSIEAAAALPAQADALLAATFDLMEQLGQDESIDRFYFLGSEHQAGIANEAMLKTTEMSLSFSNAFPFLEYRHGPMSMAGESALIAGLLSRTAVAAEQQVLADMNKLGARTLALNPTAKPSEATWEIALPQDTPDWLRPMLYLPPLQLLGYQRSMAKGLDPDNPENLTAVIYLDASLG
jgi:glucosamine--fructose-6-phosphate aminotransferase (isomerizing)